MQATVGESGTGYFLVKGLGEATLVQPILGEKLNSTGTIDVQAAGKLTVSITEMIDEQSSFVIGKKGRGEMVITGGGIVDGIYSPSIAQTWVAKEAGSSGSKVTISGEGSQWQSYNVLLGNVPGDEGIVENGVVKGALIKVSDKAAFRGNHLKIGNNAIGTVEVSTDSFIRQMDSVIVGTGDNGKGTLKIDGGAQGELEGLGVGLSKGNGTVSIKGSVDHPWLQNESATLVVIGVATIGESGTGNLIVAEHGVVKFGAALFVGHAEGGTGTITLDGPAKIVVGNNAKFGEVGKATVTIKGGAILESKFADVGRFKNVDTVVDIRGANSVWKVTSTNDFAYQQNGGIVKVFEGGILDVAGWGVFKDGILTGREKAKFQKLDVKGKGAMFVPDAETDRIATLTIETDELNATEGMTLQADLRKVGAVTENDVLAVTGAAALGGVLQGTILAGGASITPWLLNGQAGDSFTVLTAGGSLTGEFDPLLGLDLPDPNSLGLPTLPAGHSYRWRVIYDRQDALDLSLLSEDQPWVDNGTHDVVLIIEEVILTDIVNEGTIITSPNALTANYRVDFVASGSFASKLYLSTDGSTIDNPSAPLATAGASGGLPGAHSVTFSVPETPETVVPPGASLYILHDALYLPGVGFVPGGTVEEASEANNALVIHEAHTSAETAAEPAGYARFTVSVGSSSKPVTLHYETTSGTGEHPASSGVDYTHTSGTLVFAPGETTKTIDVMLVNDNKYEYNETFRLRLFNPENAFFTTLGRHITNETFVVGTITNDEDKPTLSIDDQSVSEASAAGATFTATLSNPSERPVSFTYATADGSAAGLDYTAIEATTFTFSSTETTKSIPVAITNDTLDEEDSETFFMNLTELTNATLADGQGLGTINDDDDPPTISINDVSVYEGWLSAASFEVTLSAPSGKTITLSYSTSDGSALAGLDYTAISSTTLTFAPGESSKSIDVAILDDPLDEPDAETYFVNLSGATNASLADAVGVGTIWNTDWSPVAFGDGTYYVESGQSLSIGAPGVLENDWAGSGGSHLAVLVDDTSNGTLSLGGDGSFSYTPSAGYIGGDGFTYRAFDGTNYSDVATVSIVMLEYLTLNLPARQAAPGEFTQPTSEQLGQLVQVAIAQWFASGAAPEAIRTALAGVEVRVVDLPDSRLGAYLPGVILIDTDAAGYGWFIDATPWRSEEFSRRIARSERQASEESPAFGHVDLLTVLTHEIGHFLGKSDVVSKRQAHHIMQETIGLSTRRYPAPATGQDASALTSRETLFSRLAMDESLFNRTNRISFFVPRLGRHRDWLAGVDEFFGSGGLVGDEIW